MKEAVLRGAVIRGAVRGAVRSWSSSWRTIVPCRREEDIKSGRRPAERIVKGEERDEISTTATISVRRDGAMEQQLSDDDQQIV